MVNDKKVACYARVSGESQSTEMQERELQEYVNDRSWKKVTFYVDKATGTNAQRAQLQQLLKDIRSRKIDVVLVWKLDRLFRNLKELVNTLHELNELGVGFISLKDNLDLTTSTGRLMANILGSLAEFEAELIKTRVVSGLQNARRKGIRLGRPIERVNPEIMNLRAQGVSIRDIAKRLTISKGAVQYAVLKNHSTRDAKS